MKTRIDIIQDDKYNLMNRVELRVKELEEFHFEIVDIQYGGCDYYANCASIFSVMIIYKSN